MKKTTFLSLYILRLSVVNVLGLVTTSVDLAVAIKDSLGDMAQIVLNQLIANLEKFEPMVNYPRKSELTNQVQKARINRKEIFAEIKRIVKLHSKGRDEEKKDAAQVIDFFFAGYWNVISEPMNTISGVINGMISRYKADADLQAAARVIGIDKLIIEFEVANSTFDNLYKLRLAEDAEHEASASDQKATVCKSYAEFCTVIEQAVNFNPNPEVIKLFKNMDELRKVYRNLVTKEKEPETDEKLRA